MAVDSFAMLVLYLKDKDKLQLIIPNILRPCLSDPSYEIVAATQNGLLLSMAFRSSISELNDLLLSTLNELNDGCLLLEHSEKRPTAQASISQVQSDLQNNVFSGGLEYIVMGKLRACQTLVPFVISSVIKSAPFYNETEDFTNECNPRGEGNYNLDGVVTSDHLLSMIFETQQNALQCMEDLQEYLAREWYEPWSQLNWISDVFLGLSIESATKIPVPGNLCCDTSHKLHNMTHRTYNSADATLKDETHVCLDRLILKFVDFYLEFVLIFGPSYTHTNIISKFEDRLPLINYPETIFDQNNDEVKSNVNVYSSALLPIYFLGVLKNLQSTDACQLVETIRKWCILYCLQGLPKYPLIFCLQHVLTIDQSRQNQENDVWHSEIRDALSEMAWSLVVHSSPKIRAFSGIILDILASCGKLQHLIYHSVVQITRLN